MGETSGKATSSLLLYDDGNCILRDVYDPYTGTETRIIEYGKWTIKDDRIQFAGADGQPLEGHPELEGTFTIEPCVGNNPMYERMITIYKPDGDVCEYAISSMMTGLSYSVDTPVIDKR